MSFKDDKDEMINEVLQGGDDFSTGLYIIALQQKWSFDKVKNILDTLDKLKCNKENCNAEKIKVCLNALGVDDKAISSLFDFFRKCDNRYSSLTAEWENKEKGIK